MFNMCNNKCKEVNLEDTLANLLYNISVKKFPELTYRAQREGEDEINRCLD